jgi:uncharacterized protein with WD repeat
MSEHKQKKPGEVKGLGYREEQKKPIRARWVKENTLSEKWFGKHIPNYFERKRKLEAEKRKKEAGKKAEAARKAKQSPGQGKDAGNAEVAPTGQETPKNEEARLRERRKRERIKKAKKQSADSVLKKEGI